MLHAKAPLVTRYDYQEMPEGPPYFQVIEGDLVMSPSPQIFHQEIAERRNVSVNDPCSVRTTVPLNTWWRLNQP